MGNLASAGVVSNENKNTTHTHEWHKKQQMQQNATLVSAAASEKWESFIFAPVQQPPFSCCLQPHQNGRNTHTPAVVCTLPSMWGECGSSCASVYVLCRPASIETDGGCGPETGKWRRRRRVGFRFLCGRRTPMGAMMLGAPAAGLSSPVSSREFLCPTEVANGVRLPRGGTDCSSSFRSLTTMMLCASR